MPDVQANRRQWDGDYAWPEWGDEWSLGWSGSDAQWHSTVRPRLRRFLPTGTILEIAPGFGRWTPYLVDCCQRYIGVDLSLHGVHACRHRFADVANAEFHVNDGRSLPMIADTSIDLAFSFDSLVHAEDDVMDAYLRELARVLAPDGVAFIHHSNLAACRPVATPLRAGLRALERIFRRNTGGFDQWRGTTMSARRLEELAERTGLACIGQEIVNWLGGRPVDCFSLVTPRGSRWERPNIVVDNPYFMAEAASTARAEQIHADPVTASLWLEENATAQRLGAMAKIISTSLGPWRISVVGPWPRLRRFGGTPGRRGRRLGGRLRGSS